MALLTKALAAVLMLRLSLCLNAGAGAPPARGKATRVERRLASMGTVLAVSVAAPDRASALAASETAVREIGRVEERLTTWRRGGALDRVNRARPGEAVSLDPEISALLAAVFDWSERTGGAFDPTVLPLVRAWDLRGGGRVPDAETLKRARAATGRNHFRLDAATGEARRLSPDAGIDEGAWGKGYALDRAVEALRRAGVRDAILDLGGQVSALGRTAVAVADPRERSHAAFTLVLADASVSTSGNSERGRVVEGRPIGHLLDPRTGRPALDFGSATVVAPSGLTADILSTAFFVLGPERGLALSESLRRRGFENRALFLVVAEGQLNAVASPGLEFHREGE
jgi:thiamine biosynthesis lipoprotein